jgi:endonuclease/exonuclease/phosphatase family metal-dependent hydrolase
VRRALTVASLNIHGLPSLPHVSWHPGLSGPAGGLVTFSRQPAASVSFRPFPGRHRRRAEPRRTLRGERRKGMLVTTVAGHTFVNVHLSPNRRGDWSPGSRLAALHRLQLGAVAGLAAELAGDGLVVVSGDFNVAKDSDFYREFVAGSGLADAFGDRAPVTFHPELLRPGRPSRCIDHLFFRAGQGEARVTESDLIFREKEAFGGGRQAFLSDHAGLLVRLEL